MTRTVNIGKALSIGGWMNAGELLHLALLAQKCESIVEVGSWMGRSTRALADNTKGTVRAVDTWNGSEEHLSCGILDGKPKGWLFDEFLKNTADAINLSPFQMMSSEAARTFGADGLSFDLIFLDASHDYENVKSDIEAWIPLLKEGGILAGHDYDPQFPGVIRAVNELVHGFRLIPGTTLWSCDAVVHFP